jgi:hypothetical protein
MDWMLLIIPPITAGLGYAIGRIWSLKEYLELQEKYSQLERDYRKISTRGPDGRFTKPN